MDRSSAVCFQDCSIRDFGTVLDANKKKYMKNVKVRSTICEIIKNRPYPSKTKLNV